MNPVALATAERAAPDYMCMTAGACSSVKGIPWLEFCVLREKKERIQ
jgi:hypothetical protein